MTKTTKRSAKSAAAKQAAKLSAAANKAWATRRKSGNPSLSAKVAWATRTAMAEAVPPRRRRAA